MDKQKILKDFEFAFKKNILAILLFGSHVKGEETIQSDIDICIVAPKCDREELWHEILRSVDTAKYDVEIFEELPLYLKVEVMENHRILYAKDELDLYEYFYFVRKLWKDQEHRQRLSRKELLEMFS